MQKDKKTQHQQSRLAGRNIGVFYHHQPKDLCQQTESRWQTLHNPANQLQLECYPTVAVQTSVLHDESLQFSRQIQAAFGQITNMYIQQYSVSVRKAILAEGERTEPLQHIQTWSRKRKTLLINFMKKQSPAKRLVFPLPDMSIVIQSNLYFLFKFLWYKPAYVSNAGTARQKISNKGSWKYFKQIIVS